MGKISAPVPKLSKFEKKVLMLALCGLCVDDMAVPNARTVYTELMEKLHCENRVELMLYAIRKGWLHVG